jgi:hypothetical protein
MWFATDHGVCRYNGYEFKTYNLTDNSILGLYEDYKKRIWAWSFSGRLFVFENEKWAEYKWNKTIRRYNLYGVIHSIYVDKQDNLFISAIGPLSIKITQGGSILNLTKAGKENTIKIENHLKECFTYVSSTPFHSHEIYNRSAVNTYIVEYEYAGKQRRISIPYVFWGERVKAERIGDDIILMNKDQLLRIQEKNGNSSAVVNNFLTYDVEQIEDVVFFATNDGLRIENNKGVLIEKYFQGIPIVSILKDHEGGIWLTSLTNGVYYLNSRRIEHLSLNNSLFETKVNVLQKLNDSVLIAGTDKGETFLMVPDKELDIFNMGYRSITSYYKKSDDSVYCSGILTTNPTTDIARFRYKNINFGRFLGTSNIISRNDTLMVNSARLMAQYTAREIRILMTDAKEPFRAAKLFLNHKGEILVGNNEGVWQYVDGRLKRLPIKNPLLESRVTDIERFNNDCLLLGTRGRGLLLLQNDSVMQLTAEKGISSNNIRKVFVDKEYLWLATNKGISVVHIKSTNPLAFSVVNLSVKDGLLSNEVNDIVDYNNKMVFASNKGISFVEKKTVLSKKQQPMPIYLTSIKLNSVTNNIVALKAMGFKNRNLALAYEAITYGNPGRVNYRYRLKEYDSAWNYTNNREIQFNPAPYGVYTLQIQAKTDLDEWDSFSNLISLPIVCKSPFWATTWFWVTAFSLFMLFVILFFRKRINQIRARQKQQEDLKQKINDTEQMALKAQMNPHFIFNSLNSIQQYVIDSDVEGANKFISGFSKLIRQTLEFSSKELITLDEEISYLSTYLDLEKARMESAFIYNVNVQTQQPSSQLELPPLLLQPYVENALRHGIRYLKNVDGIISLSFIEQNGFLECIIEDNGIGRKRAMELKAENPIEYQSRGMSLTAERIALLNEGKERKIEVIIEDLKDQQGNVAGTRIRVLFPV